jgi:hypothetical protein
MAHERRVSPYVDDGVGGLDCVRRVSGRSPVAERVQFRLPPYEAGLVRVPERRLRVDVPVDALLLPRILKNRRKTLVEHEVWF